MKDRARTPLLATARENLAAADWNAEALKEAVLAAGEAHGLKLGKAQAPVRVAVTGRTVGLPLFESLEVLGRERTLARIDAALAKLAAYTQRVRRGRQPKGCRPLRAPSGRGVARGTRSRRGTGGRGPVPRRRSPRRQPAPQPPVTPVTAAVTDRPTAGTPRTPPPCRRPPREPSTASS